MNTNFGILKFKIRSQLPQSKSAIKSYALLVSSRFYAAVRNQWVHC